MNNSDTTAYERVLDALQAHGRRAIDKGTKADAQCPAHDDRKASLSVSVGRDQPVILRCHRGCRPEAIVAALGLVWADVCAPRRQRGGDDDWTPVGRAVAKYDYRDETGKPLFQVCRTADKQFMPRRPDPAGKKRWLWNLRDTRRVLYNLPAVLEAVAAKGRLVYITEGEKDADTLIRHGLTATCNPGGAGKWLPEYTDVFRDSEAVVCIIADKDEPGRAHARAIADALTPVVAAVYIYEAAEGCKDATDHVAAGHSLTALVEIWSSEEPAPEALDGTGAQQDQRQAAPGDIWDQRPSLAFIRDAARAGRAGPYAVLGAVLARVIAATPPTVVLPKNGHGGYGSLNLYVALVGHSGQGKGSAQRIAAEVIPDAAFTEAGVGSGEGIAHLYVRRTRPNSAGGGEVEQHTTAALIDVPEIDTLTALGDRRAATLLPELRKAWSGEALGFAYADPTKRLPVRGHAYRLALIAGVQPGRGGALLGDTDGGTPQRFLWLPVIDPDAPDQVPPEPEPWDWKPPHWPHHRQIMAVCGTARGEIDADRVIRLRGHTPPDDLDAHALMARLKVAAALAILDGRSAATDDDWQIAAAVMEISARTRAGITAELRRAASERNKVRGTMEAERALVVAEKTQEADIRRVCATITRKLAVQGGNWTPHNKLRSSVAARDREVFEPAIDRLIEAGQIEVDPAGRGVSYRLSGGAR